MKIEPAEIRYFSDYQRNWRSLIPSLPSTDKYQFESTAQLAIQGEAPKNFIRVYKYQPGIRTRDRPNKWPAYIAKVGSKSYPNESITEQLLTRIGQLWGVNMADSQLRIVGGQVRFLSKYFLNHTQQLTHGAELFMRLLNQDMVEQITDEKRESEFFTFQVISEAVEDAYPGEKWEIMEGLTKMIAFDALIGHNDRHHFNWGVVTPVSKKEKAYFAPVYDTARALFWQRNEVWVEKALRDRCQLEAYIDGTNPQIGWDGYDKVGHFELVRHIHETYPRLRLSLKSFLQPKVLSKIKTAIENEFEQLMSPQRRQLIAKCLIMRFERYRKAIKHEVQI